MNDVEYIIDKVFGSLKERFLKIDGNVLSADRLFFAKSLVREVVEKKFSGEYDDAAAARILKVIEKFLEKELDLIRENGEVKVRVATSYDEKRNRDEGELKTPEEQLEALKEAYRRVQLRASELMHGSEEERQAALEAVRKSYERMMNKVKESKVGPPVKATDKKDPKDN